MVVFLISHGFVVIFRRLLITGLTKESSALLYNSLVNPHIGSRLKYVGIGQRSFKSILLVYGEKGKGIDPNLIPPFPENGVGRSRNGDRRHLHKIVKARLRMISIREHSNYELIIRSAKAENQAL